MHKQYKSEIMGNADYIRSLSLMGSFSKLFAESDIPYIHYRVTENLFCKCFRAENIARFDDSYDAKKWEAGIGIKTFILPEQGGSLQKIAEFDSLSSRLLGKSIEVVAKEVASWRNQRIEVANRAHAITNPSIYHIIGRMKGELKLFIVGYDKIRIDAIRIKGQSATGFAFTDGLHDYNFNRAKSTLLEKFVLSDEHCITNIPIDINPNPLEMLKRLIDDQFLGNIIRLEETDDERKFQITPIDDSDNKQNTLFCLFFQHERMGLCH